MTRLYSSTTAVNGGSGTGNVYLMNEDVDFADPSDVSRHIATNPKSARKRTHAKLGKGNYIYWRSSCICRRLMYD